MKHESYSNGDFSLFIRRYKAESVYETEFIKKVKEDFKTHNFTSITDTLKYLTDASKPYKERAKGYAISLGSSSKYVGGSIASHATKVRFKKTGYWLVQISMSYKPNYIFELLRHEGKAVLFQNSPQTLPAIRFLGKTD